MNISVSLIKFKFGEAKASHYIAYSVMRGFSLAINEYEKTRGKKINQRYLVFQEENPSGIGG